MPIWFSVVHWTLTLYFVTQGRQLLSVSSQKQLRPDTCLLQSDNTWSRTAWTAWMTMLNPLLYKKNTTLCAHDMTRTYMRYNKTLCAGCVARPCRSPLSMHVGTSSPSSGCYSMSAWASSNPPRSNARPPPASTFRPREQDVLEQSQNKSTSGYRSTDTPTTC